MTYHAFALLLLALSHQCRSPPLRFALVLRLSYLMVKNNTRNERESAVATIGSLCN